MLLLASTTRIVERWMSPPDAVSTVASTGLPSTMDRQRLAVDDAAAGEAVDRDDSIETMPDAGLDVVDGDLVGGLRRRGDRTSARNEPDGRCARARDGATAHAAAARGRRLPGRP